MLDLKLISTNNINRKCLLQGLLSFIVVIVFISLSLLYIFYIAFYGSSSNLIGDFSIYLIILSTLLWLKKFEFMNFKIFFILFIIESLILFSLPHIYTNTNNYYLNQEFDFSKKGSIYDKNITVPFSYIDRGNETRIKMYIKHMASGDPNDKFNFKLKLTITPLSLFDNIKNISFKNESTLRNQENRGIEKIVDLYFIKDSSEEIAKVFLNRWRTYNIKIESLKDVNLPVNIKTGIDIL